MWFWIGLIGTVSGLMGLGYLTRKNILVKEMVRPHLSHLGVQCGETIYTPVSNLQVPSSYKSAWNLVTLQRTPDQIIIHPLFRKFKIIIPKIYPPVGYSLEYLTKEGVQPYPYEDGTPCRVNGGEFVLKKREKKRLGFISKEVGRGQSWPLTQDGQFIWEEKVN